MTRGLRSSTASTRAPRPRPACARPQRNVRGQPHGSKRDLARARSPPLTTATSHATKGWRFCLTSVTLFDFFFISFFLLALYTRSAAICPAADAMVARGGCQAQERGWLAGSHIRYVSIRNGVTEGTEGSGSGVSVTFLVAPFSLACPTQQHTTWARLRTLGRCEAPPCVFARVVSRSALSARASAPGNSCPRVRTSSGQCELMCAHTVQSSVL